MRHFLLSIFIVLCQARRFDYDCNESLPHLSVGHLNLTDKNYSKFKKEVMSSSKVFILGASDSSCDYCCFTEELLSNLKVLFDKKKYTGRVSRTDPNLTERKLD